MLRVTVPWKKKTVSGDHEESAIQMFLFIFLVLSYLSLAMCFAWKVVAPNALVFTVKKKKHFIDKLFKLEE